MVVTQETGAIVADGRWQMADGKWQMADGKWRVSVGLSLEFHHLNLA
jgi:hypothetical protein